MKKPLPRFSFPNAFTLVELIVVIAVLAVLAAISFSTVANITSGARDSARLTDISSMKTALESYNATKWGYPLPDNAVVISWSGNLAWSQGTFGDNTARTLNTISRPKDPKWGVDYSYGISNSKKEYEIATVLEKATSYFPSEKVYAQGEQYDTIIKGNFNGVALKISSAISTWILSVPTLIASDIKDNTLEKVVFAYPKSGNEPFSYTGVVNSPQAVPALWTPKQVWSGALVLPKTDTELQQLTTDLKAAYTGSPAANNETIKSLLTTTDNKGYGSTVVNNVGGSVVMNNNFIDYNAYTTSLLHFDGNLLDTKGTNWVAVGGANISSSQSKFWGNSLYLNWAGQYLQSVNLSILPSGEDFTIDAWIYPSTKSYATIISTRGTYAECLGLSVGMWANGASIGAAVSFGGAFNTTDLGIITPNTWSHIAYVRKWDTWYLFVNGVSTQSKILAGLLTHSALSIGIDLWNNLSTNLTSFSGYIDEFRITKGVARWTSNFTPPTGPSS